MAVKAGYVDFTGDTTLTFDWEPEGFICWAVSQSGDGYLSNANFAGYTGDTGISIGFADRNGQQCATVESTQQGFAPWNDSGRAMRTDCVLVQGRGSDPGNGTDTVEAVLTGNTVELTENGTVNMRIHYVAFAGDSMSVAAGTLTMPADGSDYTVTGLDFDPSVGNSMLFCASTIDTAANDTGVLYFGMSDGDGGRNVGLIIEYNAVGGRAGRNFGVIGETGLSEVDLTAWTTDGFTLAQAGTSDSQVIAWLLINDVDTANQVTRQNESWPTAAGSISTNDFQPNIVFFAASIDGEEDTGGQITIGYAWDDNGTIVTAAALAGVANVDDQRRWTAMSTNTDSEVLLDIEGNPGTQSGQVTIDAFTSTGFDWDGAQGAGINRLFIGALASGPAGMFPQIIRWI